MQFSNLVHHAMQFEVAELTRNLAFEDIDQHDVHHCLDQYVRAVGTHVRQFLHPVRIIVVLLHLEFQLEGVRQCDLLALLLGIHHFNERHEEIDGLLVGAVQRVLVGEEVQLTDVVSVFVVEPLDVHELLHQAVIGLHGP